MTGAQSNPSTIHPASTVTNIKTYIPITLGVDSGHYTAWVELFRIHCRAYQVYDHIEPPEKSSSKDTAPDDTWLRLDSIVLQWICGTITTDLLLTILTPNTTAAKAWKAIQSIFVDSKPSRALYLQNKFSNTKLDNFPNVTAYCQELKTIADQLANVDAPVSNDRLVLQLIAGLNPQYESIATLLQQSTPLPEFYTARSKLVLEETRKANQNTLPTALHVAVSSSPPAASADTVTTTQKQRNRESRSGSDSRGHRRGRGRFIARIGSPLWTIEGSSDSTSTSQNFKSSVTKESAVKDVAIDVNSLKEKPIPLDEDSNSEKVKEFGDKPQMDSDNRELNNNNHSNHQAIRFDICPKKVNSATKLKPSLLVLNRQKRNQNKESSKGPNIDILGPGMVLMKGYISFDDQISIVKTCRELGLSDAGFYQPSYSWGNKLHLKMMCLGKNWDPESRMYTNLRPFDNVKPPGIPDKFRDMVEKAIRDSNEFIRGRAAESDKRESIPSMSPDLCIVNFYTQNGRLGLHQDKDESETSLRKGLPVVSFSLGDTAEFLYGETRSVDEAERVNLESGDVLIFGGKSRLIYHGVPSILPGTAHASLLEATDMRAGRLNLTFRMY